jgi:hypothetical protein
MELPTVAATIYYISCYLLAARPFAGTSKTSEVDEGKETDKYRQYTNRPPPSWFV